MSLQEDFSHFCLTISTVLVKWEWLLFLHLSTVPLILELEAWYSRIRYTFVCTLSSSHHMLQFITQLSKVYLVKCKHGFTTFEFLKIGPIDTIFGSIAPFFCLDALVTSVAWGVGFKWINIKRNNTYSIKYEVSPLIKILDSSEAQPRNLYNVLINGVDRVL